jgi:hypothetical protein
MAAVIHCGRLCGALRDMISGRWVEERLQINISAGDVIRNGGVFLITNRKKIMQFKIYCLSLSLVVY